MEELRWGRPEDEARYREARRNFVAAAMTAGLPRDLAERYSFATLTTWSLGSVRRGTDSASTSVDLEAYVEEVRKLLVSFLWSPWRTRLTLTKKLKALEALRQRIAAEETGDGGFLTNRYWDF